MGLPELDLDQMTLSFDIVSDWQIEQVINTPPRPTLSSPVYRQQRMTNGLGEAISRCAIKPIERLGFELSAMVRSSITAYVMHLDNHAASTADGPIERLTYYVPSDDIIKMTGWSSSESSVTWLEGISRKRSNIRVQWTYDGSEVYCPPHVYLHSSYCKRLEGTGRETFWASFISSIKKTVHQPSPPSYHPF